MDTQNDTTTNSTQKSLIKPLSKRGQELALCHFNHVEQQVALAAATAGLVVAATALILGAYITIIKEFKIFHVLGFTTQGAAFVSAGGLIVLGFLFALYAVIPNIKSIFINRTVDNILFFGWIGKQKVTVYQDEFHKADDLGDVEFDRVILEQIWGKSRWLNRMFRFIQISVLCTFFGTIIAIIVIMTCAYIISA